MSAQRDAMTLDGTSASGLGVEERSDEAPSPARPNPEVVAKPRRRQFTAAYRLRILEEADRCTESGEVGRLLRREGLYSSPPDRLAQGASEGLAAGVGLEQARREASTAQSAGCEGARARGESGSSGEGPAHRAHHPGSPGKSSRAAGIQPRRREGLLMAAQELASQVGVAPACQALGVSRATFYRRQGPAPGHQQPRPTPARARCESEREHRHRCARLPTLRRPLAWGGGGTVARRRRVPVLGAHDVSGAGREPAGTRQTQSARASSVRQA